ncbi:hypothetical protein DO97_07195 [Neosynechococcus sphagnicola sy1]|uniref:Uncharacterized protein n=1 Tax=Neosynechococcus sphagnicola sy1 TaxID=1497020 RepID=A0A098TK31_9CYAN|nr:hypothetical protein [Neosynechococcus sphagnicola]KGF72626.1 hypothetical protein DO97_07195 [Neosynechococcus sphagnicola sy1]
MLDDALILVGDLTPEEARVGIKAFNWKLNIPCGQLLIFCGGEADDEYLRETLNQQQEQHQGFAWVNVPPRRISHGTLRYPPTLYPPAIALNGSPPQCQPLKVAGLNSRPFGGFFDQDNREDPDDA